MRVEVLQSARAVGAFDAAGAQLGGPDGGRRPLRRAAVVAGVTRLASVDDEESNAVNPTDEEGKSPNTEKEEEGNPNGDGGEDPGSHVSGRWPRQSGGTPLVPVRLDGTELVVEIWRQDNEQRTHRPTLEVKATVDRAEP